MPDLPDDYPFLPGSNRFPLADLGELAARLGSIDTYDRRGEVVWQDHFVDGLVPYQVSGHGTGNAVAVSTENTNLGPKAALLTAGTTLAMDAALIRTFSVISNYRYGYELSFLPLTTFDRLELNLFHYGYDDQLNGTIIVDSVANEILVVHEPGFEILIAPWYDYTALHFHYTYIKLVGDWKTGKYVRLLVNDQEYDLSAYSLISSGPSTPNYFGVNAVLTGQASPAAKMQIGHIIITANEP